MTIKKRSPDVPERRKRHFHLVQCQSLNLKPIKCLGQESEESKYYTYLNVTDRHFSEETDPERRM